MKRPWGGYKVLTQGPEYKVKLLQINPGQRTSLQSHKHRDEFWIVLEGYPAIKLDDASINLTPGGMAEVPRETKHRISNHFHHRPAMILEVQKGAILSESDITRFADDYGRVNLQNKLPAGRVKTGKRRTRWIQKPKVKRKPNASL